VEFVYRGGVIAQDGSCDVHRRISIAANIVRNLQRKVKAISKQTIVLLYQTLVQPIVLYNSETLDYNRRSEADLENFRDGNSKKDLLNNKKKPKTEMWTY